jgi:hypothetical protein
MPRRRVCFAVADIPASVELDDWGRALVNAVLSLARRDVDVEVVSCSDDVLHPAWAQQFELAGVRMRRAATSVRVSPQEMAASWRAYRAVRYETFDAIVFQGVEGLGAVSGLARRAGLAFARTQLVEWFREATARSTERDRVVARDAGAVVTEHMERLAAETADHVIFPDDDAMGWVLEQGWRLDGSVRVQRDVEIGDLDTGWVPDSVLDGFVVVGGELGEVAHGVLRTVAAAGPPLTVPVRVAVELDPVVGDAADRLRDDLAAALGVAPADVELDHVPRAGALDELRSSGRLGVLVGEGHDLTLLAHELATERIPFVTDDRSRDARREGSELIASWLEVVRPVARTVVVHERPLVTVVIPHHDRPRLISQAVRSIGLQTYPDIELVVVDDGSTAAGVDEALARLPEVAMGRPLTVVRQPNRYLGAARNAGVRRGSGDLVAFLDDDDLAAPEYVASLVTAAATSGADAVTCAFETLDEQGVPDGGVMAFLGGPLAVGPLLNLLGGAGMLVRRSAFERVGGFHEEHGVGHEDWQLLAKIALDGGTVLAVPDPLYRYRQVRDSMIRRRDLYADAAVVNAAFAGALPPELRTWPTMLRGMHEATIVRDGRIDGLQRRVSELEQELDRRQRYIRVLQRAGSPARDRRSTDG